jgi:hypothetical protein
MERGCGVNVWDRSLCFIYDHDSCAQKKILLCEYRVSYCGTTEMSDEDQINNNICPVCNVKRRGTMPRRALQEHLRASKEPVHMMWCKINYDSHFKHGGDRRSTTNFTNKQVEEAVTRVFGPQWIAIRSSS